MNKTFSLKGGKKRIACLAASALMAVICFAAVNVSTVSADTDYEINSYYFPDDSFRTYVSENYDKNKDGILSYYESNGVKSMDLSNMGFTSLKGIEAFEDLEKLDCSNNKLTGLGLYNPVLYELNCSNNQLESLSVPSSVNKLNCSNNKLATLTLRDGNGGLTTKNAANFDNNCWIAMNIGFGTKTGQFLLPSGDKIQPFVTTEPYIVLDKYNLMEYKVMNLEGGSFMNLGYNRILAPNSYPGTVTYDYDCDDALGVKEIHVTIKFTGTGISLKNSEVALSGTSFTYTGQQIKPQVTSVRCNYNYLKQGTDYTVSYKNNVKAGTGTVTIKGKGLYSGTISKTFKIKRKSISKATLGTTSFFYNGSAKKPAVTVKAGDKVIMSKKTADNANVDLTYAKGRVKPGAYKVTVKGKGNYTGTITKTFKVKIKPTKVKKVTAGSKKMTVSWNKVDKKFITGYEIRYSKSASMNNAKTVKIAKAATTQKVINKLPAKQKYYVQIRTYKNINGKIYSSAWSAKKQATTKK